LIGGRQLCGSLRERAPGEAGEPCNSTPEPRPWQLDGAAIVDMAWFVVLGVAGYLCEERIQLNLSGNEVDYMNFAILLVKKIL
jgi:hypothetical protein